MNYPTITQEANFTTEAAKPYDKVFNGPVFICVYVLIFVPSIVCNGLVCWIVKRNPLMHTSINYMLINLAIADMLATILSIFHVVDYLAIDLHLGDVACKFRGSLVYICHGTSVFTLTAIARDRYYAICHPLTRQNLKASVKFIIPQTWLLALVVHIPPMIFCSTQVNSYKQSSCSCFEHFPSMKAAIVYAILRYLIVYVFPAIIVICHYAAIIVKFRHQPPGETQSGFTTCQTRTRVVKMLIASSLFFFLAWTPFYTIYLLRDTGVNTRKVFSFVWYLSMLLALCNCAYNPVIYCLMSKNFQEGFKMALCWCFHGVKTFRLRSFNLRSQVNATSF